MFTHIRAWTGTTFAGHAVRVDLWTTGEYDSYGKTELAYCLYLETGAVEFQYRDGIGVTFEGREFYPSPLIDVTSDAAVGALLGFFAHYGEAIYYDSATDIPDYGRLQRAALRAEHEDLAALAAELEERAA